MASNVIFFFERNKIQNKKKPITIEWSAEVAVGSPGAENPESVALAMITFQTTFMK